MLYFPNPTTVFPYKIDTLFYISQFDGGVQWKHVPYDFYTKTGVATRDAEIVDCGFSVATDGASVIMGCKDFGTVSVFSLAPSFGAGVVSSGDHGFEIWNSGEHVDLGEAQGVSATEAIATTPRAGPTSMYFNGVDTKVTSRCGSNDARSWNCGGAFASTGFVGLAPTDFLTFTAWIKPDTVVAGQTIAMLGEWGWGVLLMCPEGTYVRLSQIQRLFANTRLTLLFYFHEALGKAAAERTSRTRLGFGATTT